MAGPIIWVFQSIVIPAKAGTQAERSEDLRRRQSFVIPAQAGIQAERSEDLRRRQPLVIPAQAGTQAERSEDLRRRQSLVIPAKAGTQVERSEDLRRRQSFIIIPAGQVYGVAVNWIPRVRGMTIFWNYCLNGANPYSAKISSYKSFQPGFCLIINRIFQLRFHSFNCRSRATIFSKLWYHST